MNLSIRNQLFQVKKKPHPATAGCLENFKELKPPEPPTKSLSRRAHVSFGVVSSTVELRGKRYMEKQDPWQVWWKELRCVYPQTGKITIYHKLYKYRLYIRCGIYVYILYIYIYSIYIYIQHIYIYFMDGYPVKTDARCSLARMFGNTLVNHWPMGYRFEWDLPSPNLGWPSGISGHPEIPNFSALPNFDQNFDEDVKFSRINKHSPLGTGAWRMEM